MHSSWAIEIRLFSLKQASVEEITEITRLSHCVKFKRKVDLLALLYN